MPNDVPSPAALSASKFRVNALVLYCADIEQSRRFYVELGCPLEREQHDDGPVHYACDVGGVHIALYSGSASRALGRTEGGAAQLGFAVTRLDELVRRLVKLGVNVVRPAESVPWGRRAVVEDPDGRPIELNE